VVVSSSAKFDVRLPQAAIFDGARVTGSDAHVRFKLPPVLRFGIEARPISAVRVELAYVREMWSVHDAIELTPNGVAIEGIAGLPKRVPLPSIRFARNFQDSNSFRLGGEYTFTLGTYAVDLRGGVSYETSAIPKPYLSLLTIDMDKVTLAFGGGLHVGEHWRFDVTYAHLFASSVNVPASEARIGRVNPIAGNAPFEAVNGGSYSASADLLGLGVQYTF
jgi:long-chain fatty acid transport protein